MQLIQHAKRRWPPSPSVEDELVTLAKEIHLGELSNHSKTVDNEAVVRGTIDQQPILLEVSLPTSGASSTSQSAQLHIENDINDSSSLKTKSSNDSLGPQTPVDGNGQNYDRRYVYLSEKDIGIPVSYDRPHQQRQTTKAPQERESQRYRGKEDINRLSIDLEETQSQSSFDSSRRTPSPYAYKMSSVKQHQSGDYFGAERGGFHLQPQNTQDMRQSGVTNLDKSRHYAQLPRQNEKFFPNLGPERPPAIRHHSAMASPGYRVRFAQVGDESRSESSSEESDQKWNHYRSNSGGSRSARGSFSKPSRPLIQIEPVSSYGGLETATRKDRVPTSKRRTMSPPHGVQSAYRPTSNLAPNTGLTLDDPLDLNTYIARNHLKKGSQPYRSSTATSPYSSPPRSPTAGTAYAPTGGLRSRPSSGPASPLSVYPQDRYNPPGDRGHSSWAYELRQGRRSQGCSPLPSPEFELSLSRPGPRIQVQAPSPANEGRSYSYAGDDQQRSNNHCPSPAPLSPSMTTSFRRGSYPSSHSYGKHGKKTPSAPKSSDRSPLPQPKSRPATPVSLHCDSVQPSLPPWRTTLCLSLRGDHLESVNVASEAFALAPEIARS